MSAVICISACPGKRLIFQTRQEPSTLYLALPPVTVMVARAVWLGTGRRTTTFVAARAELKPAARTLTAASMRERPTSRMRGMTLKGRMTSSVTRYFMSSNAPSGGTKDTVLSLAKRLRFTHWWKVTSSSSMDLLRAAPRREQAQAGAGTREGAAPHPASRLPPPPPPLL